MGGDGPGSAGGGTGREPAGYDETMTSLWLAARPSRERPSTPPTLPDRADLVVVGAGITGLVTALLAQRAGRDVLVVEARYVGAVATGNTTAKVSLLQGSVLSSIRRHHGDEVTAAYVRANTDGQRLLVDLMDELGVAHQRETAVSYAHTERGTRTVEAERDAALAAGLDVHDVRPTELPYDVAGAIGLADQVQVDPVELLDALAAAFEAAGGRLVEGVRVTGTGLSGTRLRTTASEVAARQVVLATGAPVLDRGGHFTRLVAQRSYALAFRVADEATVPHGMYLSVDQPSRSVRYAPYDGQRLLLVGGNGHDVGRDRDTSRRVEQLVAWTREHWGEVALTHQWSAQDYRAENVLPVVQRLPGPAEVHVATGFNKWGMTNGPAAALALLGDLGDRTAPEWRETLRRRVPGARDLAAAAVAGTAVGRHMVQGWGEALLGPSGEPGPGEGRVHRQGAKVVATSNVDGRICSVSGVCPHLGGVLRWNAAERSWDCPLHGSRFAADGRLLEGMATRDLT